MDLPSHLSRPSTLPLPVFSSHPPNSHPFLWESQPTSFYQVSSSLSLNSHLLPQAVYQGVSQNKQRRNLEIAMKIIFLNSQYKQGNWGSKALCDLCMVRELISLLIFHQLKDTKPQRHNFLIRLPVPGYGLIVRYNQLCFKHLRETVWSSSPSSTEEGAVKWNCDVWPAGCLSHVATGLWVLRTASGSVNTNVILFPLCVVLTERCR